MQDFDDEYLINTYKTGNKNEVFNLIVKKYKVKLYWHIRKMVIDHDDTDDILQTTFIKAWKGLESFRAESKLFTWLYKIATNETLTFLNQKKRKMISRFGEDDEKTVVDTLRADEYFSGDEAQVKLQEAISTLPDKQKLVFNMKYFDDLSYEEISDILETSVGALKASFHHAVKKIENYLSKI